MTRASYIMYPWLGLTHATGSSGRVLLLGLTLAMALFPVYLSVSGDSGDYGSLPVWVVVGRAVCKVLWPIIVLLHVSRFGLESVRVVRPTRFVADFAGYIRLVALACTAGLPRFVLFDAMGGVPFSLWYGILLIIADGVAVHFLRIRALTRRWIWRAGAVALLPWGAYWWVPVWPDPHWPMP